MKKTKVPKEVIDKLKEMGLKSAEKLTDREISLVADRLIYKSRFS